MALTLTTAGLICSLTAVLLYGNTLDSGFCYDDKAAILENKDLLPNTSWADLLRNDFWGTPLHMNHSHKSYRPLCVATFRLNYLLHELEPMGYHLVNILLHGVVCYLYVQLCGLVLSEVWPALIAGLLFAVHPIHTEAVAGIVGRADLLAALFFTLSFLTYHKSATSIQGASGGWLLGSLLLATCSLLSKETGLTVTAVCVLYDHFILHKNTLLSTVELLRQLCTPSKPHSLPVSLQLFGMRVVVVGVFTCAVLCGRLWMSGHPPQFNPRDNEALTLDAPYRQLHWAHMTFVNSELLVNPSRLIHDYRMSAIPLIKSLLDYRNALTLLTLTVYGGLGLYALHTHHPPSHPHHPPTHTHHPPTHSHKVTDVRTPSNGHLNGFTTDPHNLNGHTETVANGNASNGTLSLTQYYHKVCGLPHHHGYSSKHVLLFGLTLIVIPFLPASNLFFPVGFVVAERVLYLPSMGLCLLVAQGAWTLLRHSSTSVLTKVFLVTLLLTHSAKTLTRNRDWYSKITIYGSLMRHYPSNGYVLANLAKEYRNLEQFDKAEAAYRMGVAVSPNISINYINLGAMLKKQQRFTEAEQVLYSAAEMLERTLSDDPANPDKLASLYISLSVLVGRHSDRLSQALELADKGLALNDSTSPGHNSRGSLLLRIGRHGDAVAEFRRSLELNPTNTNALYNLALAYRQRGEVGKSEQMLEAVLRADSSHKLAQTAIHELRVHSLQHQ